MSDMDAALMFAIAVFIVLLGIAIVILSASLYTVVTL